MDHEVDRTSAAANQSRASGQNSTRSSVAEIVQLFGQLDSDLFSNDSDANRRIDNRADHDASASTITDQDQSSGNLSYDILLNMEDITNEDYRRGIDIQGINWGHLPVSRQRYREMRRAHYQNYTNDDGQTYNHVTAETNSIPETEAQFFDFEYASLSEKCYIPHFQLRHLLWATSKQDVFYLDRSAIKHWNPMTKRSSIALDMQTSFRVSTFCAKHGVLISGGFLGEIACVGIETKTDTYSSVVTDDQNAILNHIDVEILPSGRVNAMLSDNDQHVRFMDVQSIKTVEDYSFSFSPNCSAFSPISKLLCVVGDQREGVLMDTAVGKQVATLTGHEDYSFACAWSQNGTIIATGNQDKTCRLYDIRNLSTALKVLPGTMSAIRSLHFSEDGDLLAMTEAADFVHLLDVKSDFTRSQTIDIFGEIGGVAFTPDSNRLFIADGDETYGALLEYERIYPKELPYFDQQWLI